jgi:hypothetical protein
VIIEIHADFRWQDRLISGTSRSTSGKKDGRIVLMPERRGKYLCGSAGFLLRDPAGFFKIETAAGREECLSVLPEKLVFEKSLVLMSSGGELISRKNRKKRSEDFIEIRQYYPGDDIRRINWKAFAHSGELFIRVGEEKPLPESKLSILLDLSGPSTIIDEKNSSLYLDLLVSKLAGLIEELESNGLNYDLTVFPCRADDFSVEKTLSGLWWSDYSELSTGFAGGTIGGRAGRKGRGSSVLLVTSPFSKIAIQAGRRLTAAGRPVTAIVPVPDDEGVLNIVSRMKALFLAAEMEDETSLSLKSADILRIKAAEMCRELKMNGGARDAFLI